MRSSTSLPGGRRILSAVARALGAVLIAAGIASAAGARESVEQDKTRPSGGVAAKQAEAIAREIMPRVEAIRGLRFKRNVKTRVIGDAAAGRYAVDRFHRFTSDAEIRAQQKAYGLLGLLPPGTDIVAEYLKVLEEQAGGFYDPTARALYVLDDMPAGLAPILESHELTHALEDQRYGLDERLEQARGDDDRVFAISAVHEGSASIVMGIYAADALQRGELKLEDIQSLERSEAGKAAKLGALAPALRRQLLGAYLLGVSFLLRGDVTALAKRQYPVEDAQRCFADTPRSSEQILHPEKYWDPSKRDEPRAVELGNAGRLLGDGFKRTGFGILGELMIGVLTGAPTPSGSMAEGVPGAQAWTNAAAEGWGGDRWELWTKGDAAVVLLKTVWDTEHDAEEFANALAGRPGLVWKQKGDRVGVVAGDAGEKVEPLLDALVNGTAGRERE